MWPRAVSLVNANVVTPVGITHTLRFGRRVLALGAAPARGDIIHDLQGAWVLPGLVNAHDHLELNHYGAQVGHGVYRNVREWVDHMRPRLSSDPVLMAGRRRPLAARLFAGSLKNLLSGVTLVAHHNPMYPGVRRVSPVSVLRRFGWAHSLGMEEALVGACGERGGVVTRRFRDTPPEAPFILHAAEGTDQEAALEIPRLDHAGVLAPNTVLVHALAAEHAHEGLLAARRVGLVWCPTSNLALFGRTWTWARARAAFGDRIGLGTDSRLTGSRDLLDELRIASGNGGVTPDERLALVTTWPAQLLRCASAGRLVERAPADFIVIPPHDGPAGDALLACRRADVQLVVTGGRPRVGAAAFAPVFAARGVTAVCLILDGSQRHLDAEVARACRRYAIAEPGLRLPAAVA